MIPPEPGLSASGQMDLCDSAADARLERHVHQLRGETQYDFVRVRKAKIFPEFRVEGVVLMRI